MVDDEQLPDDLKPLTRWNAIRIVEEYYDEAVDRLVRSLTPELGEPAHGGSDGRGVAVTGGGGNRTNGGAVTTPPATVLDIDTTMGEGAQLGHRSSLHTGQAVFDVRGGGPQTPRRFGAGPRHEIPASRPANRARRREQRMSKVAVMGGGSWGCCAGAATTPAGNPS